jgi:hypothetical protein
MIFLILFLFLLLSSSALAENATSDTYVRSDQPNTHFDASPTNPLQLDGDPIRRPFLYFQNAPAQIYSAKLRIHSEWHTFQSFEVRASSCFWSEGGLPTTYNRVPSPGEVLATVPDDPVGYLEVTIPPDKLHTGSNCFQLTKSGDLWTNMSSTTSSTPPQLVIQQNAPPVDSDGDGVPDLQDACPGTPAGTQVGPDGCPLTPSGVAPCGGTPVNATPSTLSSIIANNDSVTINAGAGTYSSLSMYPSTPKTCIEIHCPSFSCTVSGESTIGAIRRLIIEGFKFTGGVSSGADYGLAIYDESPYVGMRVKIANNTFNGSFAHDVSTKERVLYTEVVNNNFINCARHCWEIGQNGNIPSRPSTTGIAIFRGNTVSSLINGLTQRYNLNLIVENNNFGNVAGYVVNTWPFWTIYLGELNLVPGTYSNSDPKVPLRTTLTGNTFSSGNRLRFTGRGVIDDVVLVKGNIGIPSCVRGGMDSQDSGTSAAHSNEETLAPPQLDPTSDISC